MNFGLKHFHAEHNIVIARIIPKFQFINRSETEMVALLILAVRRVILIMQVAHSNKVMVYIVLLELRMRLMHLRVRYSTNAMMFLKLTSMFYRRIGNSKRVCSRLHKKIHRKFISLIIY